MSRRSRSHSWTTSNCIPDRQTEIDRKRERKRECVLKRGERKSDRILDVDIYFLKMECVSRGMGCGARSR